MRRITIGQAPPTMFQSPEGRFLLSALEEIRNASFQNDPSVIASDFTVTNHTDTRELDVDTATLTDLKNFVATLVLDLARGGSKKG